MTGGGIGRASMLLASGTMVSRVLGFVKAIVLAQTIGVVGSVSANAFANANQLPGNIYSIISVGMLNAVLVPQVVRAARHSDGGQQYINRLVTLAIAVLGGLAIIATVASPLIAGIYGTGLTGEQLSLVIAFTYWCMPQVFFYGMYAVLGEILNARGVFGPYAWAPVLNNVIGIAFLWLFAALYGADPTGQRLIVDWDTGMIALLGSTTTAGVALQALILFLFWKKAGLRYRPDFMWRGTGLGQAGRLAGWTIGTLIVMQFVGLVETIIVNQAFEGAAGLAAMQNAYLIFVLPHSIVAVSIATATFTRMSAAASEGRDADLVRDFSSGGRLIGLFIMFAAWALAVISPPFARIFESSAEGVTDLAIILCCFLVGLVTFCGLFLVQRAFYALEDTKTQFWVFLATMPLHVFGMAIVITVDVRFIAAGLALVQSLMSAIRLVILLWLLRRYVGNLDTRRIVHSYLRFAIASVGAALVGAGLMWLLGAYSEDGWARSSILAAFVACAVGGTLMVVLYVVLLAVVRSEELNDALGPILRRILPRIGLAGLIPRLGLEARDDETETDVDDDGVLHPSTPGGAPAFPGVVEGDEAAGDSSPGPGSSSRAESPSSHETAPTARRRGEFGWGRQAPVGRARSRDDAWAAWANSPADITASGYGDSRPSVDRRDEYAYIGAFATHGAAGDLSTAGILLPMHATPGSGPSSRRERREMEERAARAKRQRHTSDAEPETTAPKLRGSADEGARLLPSWTVHSPDSDAPQGAAAGNDRSTTPRVPGHDSQPPVPPTARPAPVPRLARSTSAPQPPTTPPQQPAHPASAPHAPVPPAPQPPGRPGVSGPAGAAERRRAQRAAAAAGVPGATGRAPGAATPPPPGAHQAPRRQPPQGRPNGAPVPPGAPHPAQPPVPHQQRPPQRHATPPMPGQPRAAQRFPGRQPAPHETWPTTSGPVKDHHPDDDADSLFDELFGDDEQ